MKHDLMLRDKIGIAVEQSSVNGFDISYNPDDDCWYVCDKNEYNELKTRAVFQPGRKGFHNARYWAKTHKPD